MQILSPGVEWNQVIARVKASAVLPCAGLIVLVIIGCAKQTASTQGDRPKPEQDLPLTFGGFLQGGPQEERLTGVCTPDLAREVLNCDVYNGLPAWKISEITIVVTWSPYNQEDKRSFRVPTAITPMTTEHCAVRLGLQLPEDEWLTRNRRPQDRLNKWGWQIMGAKGYRIQ
jgi:hypothetical protein